MAEINPTRKSIRKIREWHQPISPEAAAQFYLRKLCEAEGVPGWGPVHQDKRLDRLGKIRDAFQYLKKQIMPDPDYTSFARAIHQVFDQRHGTVRKEHLKDPKFRERLTQLFNQCKYKRKRIEDLFSCLDFTLSQLKQYLFYPEEEPRRRQAIDEAIQSWQISDELLGPFFSYDKIVKESPSEYFGGPPTADQIQEELRELFEYENVKGWGTPGGVSKAGYLIGDLEQEYERLQRNASFLSSTDCWKLLVWKVQELLNSPPGTQPDEEFRIFVRQDLRQVQSIYEKIQSQWTKFVGMAEELAPLLSQKESTPERDRALPLVKNMWDLFRETLGPVDHIAEKWPQLLPPEGIEID